MGKLKCQLCLDIFRSRFLKNSLPETVTGLCVVLIFEGYYNHQESTIEFYLGLENAGVDIFLLE